MTPRQVGNYRLDSLLGSGGMGEVYQAYDTYRDRYVALKLLPAGFSGDPEYLKRFQRESHVAARLREPHVIPIHDFGEIDGQLFIDMRLVDGSDIGALLDTNDRIEPERAVHLIDQVAQALDAAHADDLVHRDIKPSNILVTSNDFVYVVDFGIARSIGGRQTALTITGATIGTLHYMAPERFVGQDVDGRADVYSLACVLHECLTGAPPFTGKDLPALMYAQLYSGPPPASGLVDGVPPALDAVIARGMAKNPDDRFPTAGALAAAASEALLTEAPAPAGSPALTGTPPLTATSAPPPMTELPAPAWAEMPAPAWQPAPAMRHASDGPTQTVIAADVGGWGGVQPPRNVPQVASPEPDGGRRTAGEAQGGPGGPARRPSRRRLGVLLLVVAAAVAIPVVIVLMASAKPSSSASGTLSAGGAGATVTGTAGATATGTAAAAGAAGATGAGLPTVAEQVAAGQDPSYVEVAPNGQFAYVTNPGAGVITVLNTATDLAAGTVKIPQGPPQFVSFSPDSRTAYVSVYNPSTKGLQVHLIAFVDTATGKVTSTVQVDNFTPGPSTTSPDGRLLYVPNHNTVLSGTDENVVDVISTTTRKLVGHITVPANPHWVAYAKNGLIYTTDHLSAKVTVVNAATDSIVTEIGVGETPHSEALSPDGSRLAVTSFNGNEVFLIDTATDRMIKQIPVGTNPVDIAYSPDGKYLYTVNNAASTVTVIDTADNRVIGTIRTGKSPTSISVLPNGRQAYVSDENDGTVEVLNLPS